MSPSATEPLRRVSARSGHYPSRKNHPHLSLRWMNGKSGEMKSALLGRQKYGNYVQSYAKLSQAFFFKGGIFFSNWNSLSQGEFLLAGREVLACP